MRQNPGIKVTEVVKQIAKLWQSLSKEEKQRYKEAAKDGKCKQWKTAINLYIRQGAIWKGIEGPYKKQQDSKQTQKASNTLYAICESCKFTVLFLLCK
jgi:hypothetical protein